MTFLLNLDCFFIASLFRNLGIHKNNVGIKLLKNLAAFICLSGNGLSSKYVGYITLVTYIIEIKTNIRLGISSSNFDIYHAGKI